MRKVTQLSLTFDHRVCDGGTAGGFLRFVADGVERPVRLSPTSDHGHERPARRCRRPTRSQPRRSGPSSPTRRCPPRRVSFGSAASCRGGRPDSSCTCWPNGSVQVHTPSASITARRAGWCLHAVDAPAQGEQVLGLRRCRPSGQGMTWSRSQDTGPPGRGPVPPQCPVPGGSRTSSTPAGGCSRSAPVSRSCPRWPRPAAPAGPRYRTARTDPGHHVPGNHPDPGISSPIADLLPGRAHHPVLIVAPDPPVRPGVHGQRLHRHRPGAPSCLTSTRARTRSTSASARAWSMDRSGSLPVAARRRGSSTAALHSADSCAGNTATHSARARPRDGESSAPAAAQPAWTWPPGSGPPRHPRLASARLVPGPRPPRSPGTPWAERTPSTRAHASVRMASSRLGTRCWMPAACSPRRPSPPTSPATGRPPPPRSPRPLLRATGVSTPTSAPPNRRGTPDGPPPRSTPAHDPVPARISSRPDAGQPDRLRRRRRIHHPLGSQDHLSPLIRPGLHTAQVERRASVRRVDPLRHGDGPEWPGSCISSVGTGPRPGT